MFFDYVTPMQCVTDNSPLLIVNTVWHFVPTPAWVCLYLSWLQFYRNS